MTQQIKIESELALQIAHKIYNSKTHNIGMFKVKAKHIEGTQLCSIELPCKYKDKELTVVVYEFE